MEKEYGVTVEKVWNAAHTDYMVNHTTFIYLVGPDGSLRDAFGSGDDAAHIAELLARRSGDAMTESCCSATPARVSPWRLYRPLIIVLALSIILSAVNVIGGLVMAGKPGAPLGFGWGTAMAFMNGAMGLFMLLLGGLQARRPRAFAALFAAYDPLARRLPAYGLAYPFLTMALGLAYLSGFFPLAVNALHPHHHGHKRARRCRHPALRAEN